jgi:signal transduction histidine kinase
VTGPSLDHRLARRGPAHAADSELDVRGLLHDLGHQLMTLSLLADSVRDDSALSADSRQRMELVMQEMFRIVDIIADAMPRDARPAAPSPVDIRVLADEVAQLADLAYDTAVIVAPGGPAVMHISASVMWRVLANLVDNAVRAAGPAGRVTIRIEQELDTALEVTDNGPGPGAGQPGVAGLGLTVVRQLLDSADGHLDICEAPAGGTCVRVTFGSVQNSGGRP